MRAKAGSVLARIKLLPSVKFLQLSGFRALSYDGLNCVGEKDGRLASVKTSEEQHVYKKQRRD